MHAEDLTLLYRLRQGDDIKKDTTFYSLESQKSVSATDPHSGMADFDSTGALISGSQKNQDIVDLAVNAVNDLMNEAAILQFKANVSAGRLPTFEGLEGMFPEYVKEYEDSSQALTGGGNQYLSYDLPEDFGYILSADISSSIIGLEFAQCVMADSSYVKAVRSNGFEENDVVPYLFFEGGSLSGKTRAKVFIQGEFTGSVTFNLLYVSRQPRIQLNANGTFDQSGDDIVLNRKLDKKILSLMMAEYELIKKTTQ